MSDDSDQQSDDDVNMGRPGPAAGVSWQTSLDRDNEFI